jgi:hypothetical protein
MTIDALTLLEASLNMSLRCTCSIDKAFSGKQENFQSWDCVPQVSDYQHFQITGCRIKGILLYLQPPWGS